MNLTWGNMQTSAWLIRVSTLEPLVDNSQARFHSGGLDLEFFHVAGERVCFLKPPALARIGKHLAHQELLLLQDNEPRTQG